MELQGKVIAMTPERSGVNARGEWKARDYVIETHETYPKKMVFSVMGDRLERFNIQLNQEVLVSFDIDAHEYNGRWFNSIRAFDVRLVDPATLGAAPQAAPQAPPASAPASQDPFQAAEPTEGQSTDDLPF